MLRLTRDVGGDDDGDGEGNGNGNATGKAEALELPLLAEVLWLIIGWWVVGVGCWHAGYSHCWAISGVAQPTRRHGPERLRVPSLTTCCRPARALRASSTPPTVGWFSHPTAARALSGAESHRTALGSASSVGIHAILLLILIFSS